MVRVIKHEVKINSIGKNGYSAIIKSAKTIKSAAILILKLRLLFRRWRYVIIKIYFDYIISSIICSDICIDISCIMSFIDRKFSVSMVLNVKIVEISVI
jgi:hypothetical protein